MQLVEVSNTQPIQMVRLSLVRKVLDAYTDPKSISLAAYSARSAAARASKMTAEQGCSSMSAHSPQAVGRGS